MKQYKKVELIAKNQIAGSYAASCPSKDRGDTCFMFSQGYGSGCANCDRTK